MSVSSKKKPDTQPWTVKDTTGKPVKNKKNQTVSTTDYSEAASEALRFTLDTGRFAQAVRA